MRKRRRRQKLEPRLKLKKTPADAPRPSLIKQPRKEPGPQPSATRPRQKPLRQQLSQNNKRQRPKLNAPAAPKKRQSAKRKKCEPGCCGSSIKYKRQKKKDRKRTR